MPRYRFPQPPAAEITPEPLYRQRRQFIEAGLRGAALLAAGGLAAACTESGAGAESAAPADPDPPTPYADASQYNNYYEFGTAKTDPARHAQGLRTRPWSVTLEGEVDKPGVYDLEDLLKPHPAQERVYRLRCVETWSMVIPWQGVPLGDLLRRFGPTSKAKFVEFVSLHDPEQMPGQTRGGLAWPYREGLRIDEATHPLTLLATGMYGKPLPNQNGAPLRLVVPWKYGFKSIKGIVKIRLRETPPETSWNLQAPAEYGFYANVNPRVDHPRWSQARERRIGEFLKRETLPFNGYAEQVADLYAGMDLSKFF